MRHGGRVGIIWESAGVDPADEELKRFGCLLFQIQLVSLSFQKPLLQCFCEMRRFLAKQFLVDDVFLPL